MSDGQLLQTAHEDGLLPEAKQALHEEIRRRNLKPRDIPHSTEPHKTHLEKQSEEKWLPALGWHRTGFGLCGHAYLNQSDRESNIQVRTKFFVLSGLPLVPVASFRFKYPTEAKKWYGWDDDHARVVNRIPIVWPQVFRIWLAWFLWISGAIAAFVVYDWLKGRHPHF